MNGRLNISYRCTYQPGQDSFVEEFERVDDWREVVGRMIDYDQFACKLDLLFILFTSLKYFLFLYICSLPNVQLVNSRMFLLLVGSFHVCVEGEAKLWWVLRDAWFCQLPTAGLHWVEPIWLQRNFQRNLLSADVGKGTFCKERRVLWLHPPQSMALTKKLPFFFQMVKYKIKVQIGIYYLSNTKSIFISQQNSFLKNNDLLLVLFPTFLL